MHILDSAKAQQVLGTHRVPISLTIVVLQNRGQVIFHVLVVKRGRVLVTRDLMKIAGQAVILQRHKLRARAGDFLVAARRILVDSKVLGHLVLTTDDQRLIVFQMLALDHLLVVSAVRLEAIDQVADVVAVHAVNVSI